VGTPIVKMTFPYVSMKPMSSRQQNIGLSRVVNPLYDMKPSIYSGTYLEALKTSCFLNTMTMIIVIKAKRIPPAEIMVMTIPAGLRMVGFKATLGGESAGVYSGQ
jgi:hypothetical protein